MDINLLNKIISDLPNTNDVSDGVFTIGQLHRDRVSLLANLLELVTSIYALKGIKDILWVSLKNHKGEVTEGYFHLGTFKDDKDLLMGALMPLELWDEYKNKAVIVMTSPKYKPLSEVLSFYSYSSNK